MMYIYSVLLWRIIMAAKPLLLQGLRRTINSGCDTKVWSDPWIPDILVRPARELRSSSYIDQTLLVQSLIRREKNEWDVTTLKNLVHSEDIPLILGLRPSRIHVLDGYTWSYTKSGVCTIKSGY